MVKLRKLYTPKQKQREKFYKSSAKSTNICLLRFYYDATIEYYQLEQLITENKTTKIRLSQT